MRHMKCEIRKCDRSSRFTGKNFEIIPCKERANDVTSSTDVEVQVVSYNLPGVFGTCVGLGPEIIIIKTLNYRNIVQRTV